MTRYKKGPEHYYLQQLSVVVKYRCEPQVKRSNVLQRTLSLLSNF